MKKKNGKTGLVSGTFELSGLTKREADALTDAVLALVGAVAWAKKRRGRVDAEFFAGKSMPKTGGGGKHFETRKWF